MQATAEQINHEADVLANANVPALSRPFDYGDVGATAVNEGPWAVEVKPYEGPALEGSSNANSATMATASAVKNIKKLCAPYILAEPTITQNEVLHAGERNQFISLQFDLPNVPKKCDPKERRVVTANSQLVKGHHSVNMNGPLHGNALFPAYYPATSTHSNRSGEGGMNNINSNNLKVRYWEPGDTFRYVIRIQEVPVRGGKPTGKVDNVKTYRGDIPLTQ